MNADHAESILRELFNRVEQNEAFAVDVAHYNVAKAQVWATLAVADSINDLVNVVRDLRPAP